MNMRIIVQTKEAVYARLPLAQQQVIECDCPHCKNDPTLAKWDTLVIPTEQESGQYTTYTVHMPDASIASFKTFMRAKGQLLY